MTAHLTVTADTVLTNERPDMNAVEEKPHSKDIVTRWHPMREIPPLTKPASPAPSKPTLVRPSANSAPTPISADFDLKSLSRDANGSHLVNFPFALTAFLVLGLGLF